MVNLESLIFTHMLKQLARGRQCIPKTETCRCSECFKHYSTFSIWIPTRSVM